MADRVTGIGARAKEQALKAFGARLRQLRVAAGLRQQSVAETLDVSDQTVRNWEAGRNEPGPSYKQRIADLYRVPIDPLVGQETDLVDLADPDLSLFFRGEWGEFNDDERDFMKGLILESRDLLRKRREAAGQ